MGSPEEAEACFHKALKRTDAPDNGPGKPDEVDVSWWQDLELKLLLEEAQAKIGETQ